MNDLFERFVTRILSGQLSPDISISSQVRRHLDGARKIAMRLDLEFHSLGRTIAVGDCKYKRASSKDGNVGDVYQVLAYATARGVGTGLLIYPMHETSVDDELQVLNTDISIFRMPINLGVDARFVMDECNRFAQRVKTVLVQETSKSVSQLAASRAPLLHARA
jgi:5-methylcytosine-specific restriction enzyme subunit McrC